jgi:hypothetical protein
VQLSKIGWCSDYDSRSDSDRVNGGVEKAAMNAREGS